MLRLTYTHGKPQLIFEANEGDDPDDENGGTKEMKITMEKAAAQREKKLVLLLLFLLLIFGFSDRCECVERKAAHICTHCTHE